jgi:hypothetical protein
MISVVECAGLNWSPQIGDPTALGWVTVAAYFATAVASMFALRFGECDERHHNTYRLFWTLTAIVFVCLGFNKQLDLQSLFTAVARCIAKIDGWYADRQKYQVLFIGFVFVGSIAMLFAAAKYFWDIFPRIWLALLGLACVTTFVAVRAMSFHHVDRLIGSHVLGMRMNGVLELSGICLVALNAFWLAVRRRSREAN